MNAHRFISAVLPLFLGLLPAGALGPDGARSRSAADTAFRSDTVFRPDTAFDANSDSAPNTVLASDTLSGTLPDTVSGTTFSLDTASDTSFGFGTTFRLDTAFDTAFRPGAVFRPDTVSLVFIGDVMLHAGQIEADYGPFLSELSPKFKEADFAVANMEFALAGPPYTGYPSFSAPDRFAEYVSEQGINVFLTANNHVLDKGAAGLKRTLDRYGEMEREGKIRFTGAAADAERDTSSYPLILKKKGLRIALLNFTYGSNAPVPRSWPKVNLTDRKDILAALDRAKRQKADWIIALPHWGVEYRLTHSEEQERLAKWLAANGADVVIGTHPHVVQDFAEIQREGGTVPVFYSLGNAISNMSAKNTRLGLLVRLRFVRTAVGTELLQPETEFLWCTLPGRKTDSYCTGSVRDWLEAAAQWRIPADHEKMRRTCVRVSRMTGIGGGLDLRKMEINENQIDKEESAP